MYGRGDEEARAYTPNRSYIWSNIKKRSTPSVATSQTMRRFDYYQTTSNNKENQSKILMITNENTYQTEGKNQMLIL